VLEFEYAKYGNDRSGTSLRSLKTAMPEVSENKWVELLSISPGKIFGWKKVTVQNGAPALLTLFEPGSSTDVTDNFF